ncbi:hypothetical protein KDL44_10425 [bacterium]|nr:hypothetical protein [bacterium]
MHGKYGISLLPALAALALLGSCAAGPGLDDTAGQQLQPGPAALQLELPDTAGRPASALGGMQAVLNGHNLLQPEQYLQSSFDVGVVNYLGTDVLEFPETGDDFSYVLYGLSGVISYHEIDTLSLDTLSDDQGRIFHVAVSDYESGRFEWYGPFTDATQFELDLLHSRNVSPEGNAYVIVGVSGSEALSYVGNIDVEVSVIPGSPVDPLA